GKDFDRGRRRADGAQPPRGVELGASRVQDADDDAVDAKALLRDLGDYEVGVVSVGRNDDGFRLVDSSLVKHLDVHAVSDDEPSGPVLSEPSERLLLLVDGHHVPTLALELLRDGRADTAASNDYCLHRTSLPQRSRSSAGPVLLQDALWERDDEHLAGCPLQHVLDRWREEPRLSPPARRRPDNDQVRVAP